MFPKRKSNLRVDGSRDTLDAATTSKPSYVVFCNAQDIVSQYFAAGAKSMLVTASFIGNLCLPVSSRSLALSEPFAANT